MGAERIFKALGDPIRLEMVERLSKNSPISIVEVSDNLGITRQGARKQLNVLVDAKIVRLIPRGRETEVHLNTKEISKAKDFIEKLELIWDKRLQALKIFVELDN